MPTVAQPTRSRTFAWTATLLFLVPLMLALVPTAAAATGLTSVTVEVGVPDPSRPVRIGDTMTVFVNGSVSFGTTCTVTTQRVDATADLTQFGAFSATETVGSKVPSGATSIAGSFSLSKAFTVGTPTSPNLPSNGTAVTLTASVTARCTEINTVETATQTASRGVTLDNSPPTGQITSFTINENPGKIGSILQVRVAGTDAAGGATLDLRRYGLTAAEPIPLDTPTSFTVKETPSPVAADVTAKFTDSTGNTFTTAAYASPPSADTVRPTIGSITLIPKAGGHVHVRPNTPSTTTDVAAYTTTIERPDGSSFKIFNTTGGLTSGEVNITSDNFTLGQPYKIVMNATDTSGNSGPVTAVKTAVPAAQPAFVTVTPITAPVKQLSSVGGAWTSADPATTKLEIRLMNVTNPSSIRYWDFAGEWDAGMSTSESWSEVTGLTGTSWSRSFTTGPGRYLPNGTYQLSARLFVGAGADTIRSPWDNITFIIDKAAPVIGLAQLNPVNDTFGSRAVTAGYVQGESWVNVQVDVTDRPATGGSNLSSFVVRLTDTTADRNVVSTVTCPGANCILTPYVTGARSPTFPPGAAGWNGNVTVRFLNAPLGDHFVHIVAKDNADNSQAVEFAAASDVVRVVPRLAIAEGETTPFAYANGVEIRTYAAFHGASSLDPAESACPNMACRVTSIEYRARNSSATNDGFLLDNRSAPFSTTQGHYLGSNRPLYYNYTPTRFDVTAINAALHPSHLQVKAIAYVLRADGTYASHATDWIRVRTGEAPAGLHINVPPTDWMVNMTGAPGSVHFNASFEATGISGLPVLNYTLRDISDPAVPNRYLNIQGTGNAVVRNSAAATYQRANVTYFNDVIPTSGVFTYNWRNNATIPAGEYELNITVRDPTNSTVLKFGQRYFAVESRSPTITFLHDSTSDIYDGRFVTRAFNLSFRIDHYFANVTPQLLIPTLELDKAGRPRLSDDEGGFDATLTSFEKVNESSTNATYRVTLPASSLDSDRFTFMLNVTTDGNFTCNCPQANGTASQLLILDDASPAVGIFRDGSNATGRNIADQLVVKGFAEDQGAGIKKAEVRLYDATHNVTFVWDSGEHGDWFAGDLDSWLTSDLLEVDDTPAHDVRNVFLQRTAGTSVWTWDVNDSVRPRLRADGTVNGHYDPIGLNRTSTYRVDVRVTDFVGKTATATTTLLFDPDAPVIVSRGQSGYAGGIRLVGGATEINWHSTSANNVTSPDTIEARLSDNHCIKMAYLKGRAPSGDVVSANFSIPTGARCSVAAAANGQGDPVKTWSINLLDHPHMTNEVGVYHYWVEVEDLSGKADRINPANGNNLTLRVKDTKPATVVAAQFEPSRAQAGGSTRLHVNIDENAAIGRIDVTLYRLTATNAREANLGTVQMAPDTLRGVAANGSGWYVLDVANAFNLTLEVGNYDAEVRPRDAAGVGCTPSSCYHVGRAVLSVVADAAPDVLRELPGANVTYLNATPTLQFRVLDPGVIQDKIVVTAGENGTTLAAVNATLTPILTGGNVTGYTVVVKPNATGVKNLSVSVSATDSSGFTTTLVEVFPVDAEAPTVNATVTGTVLGADNRTYAVAGTRVTLEAADNLSGLAQIGYMINTGAPQLYTGPIAPLAANPPDGRLLVTYAARDNASNAASGTLELYVDQTGPVVTVSNDGSTGQDVVISVRDDGVGVNESSLFLRYAYGTAQTFSNATFEKVSGNLFKVTLPGNASTTGLRYYIESRDLLGNAGPRFSAANPFVIDPEGEEPVNNAPVVDITQPADGAAANGTLTLRWTATDADGDDLTITIALREPVGAGRVLVSAGENSGLYTLDVTDLAAGTYTLVVTASDESETGQDEVSFRIAANTTTPANPVRLVQAPAANSTAGRELTFAVQLDTGGRTLRSATFTVMRDGQQVGNGTLIPLAAGLRGTYTPTAPGNYAVFVAATFDDGTSMPATQATTFSVQEAESAPAAAGFPTSLMMLLAVGVLTIALAAYGAFGRWRK